MGKGWTEERKKAHSQKMKAYHSKKKAAGSPYTRKSHKKRKQVSKPEAIAPVGFIGRLKQILGFAT